MKRGVLTRLAAHCDAQLHTWQRRTFICRQSCGEQGDRFTYEADKQLVKRHEPDELWNNSPKNTRTKPHPRVTETNADGTLKAAR